ncbi:MAG: threonyl-tRNA synthetase editing domain-containing protein [Ktedonobacterales bacterium]
MRLLIWHVDRFVAEPVERGRSKVANATPETVRMGEGLLVFAAVEKADEGGPQRAAERATETIIDIANQLGARDITLHSFAHLFVELAAPAIAQQILNQIQALLEQDHYAVAQSAFGWFNRLEISAKGHPLSRIARQI